MGKTFLKSICAGILIAIGGSVFLSCENRTVGAVLFSVALLCICYKGYVLFTGKIGYVVYDHKANDILALAVGLIGNLATTLLLGLLIRYAVPSIGAAAETVCAAKLTQAIPQTFIRSCFCGILMYLAVSIYKEKTTVWGIIFCIPVFILSGFEHSIADMFYFGACGTIDLQTVIFQLVVIAGNTLGGVLLPLLNLPFSEKNAKGN